MFPPFSDEAIYPDEMLEMKWSMATCYVSDSDCGRLSGKCRENALYLMLAHLLYLATKANEQAATTTPGSIAGARGGIVTSATIDKVSVSLLPPPVTDSWDWWLQQTPYGSQLLALLSSFVGGFSVGGLPEQDGFRKVYGVFGPGRPTC